MQRRSEPKIEMVYSYAQIESTRQVSEFYPEIISRCGLGTICISEVTTNKQLRYQARYY